MQDSPVYIDMHGLGPAPDPGPVWKRCWMGREPLWRVFWGWFICGHGAFLGATVGLMVMAMLFGFIVAPQSLNAGVTGMATGAVVFSLATVPYVLWVIVSLWRCAYNCLNRKWGHFTRLIVIMYGVVLTFLTYRTLM
jgi:hypothetical protein